MSRPFALAPAAAARPAAQGSLRAALAAVAATLRVWAGRRRSRRDLMDLSPDLLRDIGLDREAALAEVRKPFWMG